MNCEEVKKLSAGYLMDAVPKQYRSEVEEHLSNCPVCSYLMEQMSKLREKIKNCLCCDDCCPTELKQQIHKMLAGK